MPLPCGASHLQRFTIFKFLLPSLLALSITLGAEESLQAVVGPGENPVQLRFAAMDALLHGNSKDALDLYETAIQEALQQYGESSTFLADLYYEAGTVALDSSQFPAAEHYLTLAVKINPYSTMAKIKLAELYRLQIKPEEASKQFRQAVQINPNSPVTRQAYIRWLAANGTTSQENAIATQEALKLALLNAHTNEIVQVKDRGTTRSAPAAVLSPALIAPLVKQSNVTGDKKPETIESETKSKTKSKTADEKAKDSEVKAAAAKPKAVSSLLNFRDVNKGSAEKEKAKQEAVKKEAAKNEAAKKEAARKEAAAREAAARLEAEHEGQRKASRAARAARAAAPKVVKTEEKKEPVKELAKKTVKPGEAKVAPAKAIEATEATETKKIETKARVEKALQPNIVPSAQPMYQPVPQMIYQMPVMQQPPSKTKGGSKRTMVPPPPPTMPMYQPMPMMRPMPFPQPQPQAKPKAKPAAKPVKEDAPEAEEKPAVINPSSEPDFLIDWGGGNTKKKGK